MYKLRKGFELPKEFKVVVTPEQSEALQKHLFKKWGANDQVRNTEFRYIIVYCGIKALFIFDNITSFAAHTHPQIDFDYYFEKVDSFPEKWCIEVTEDNYRELNTWMHRNWKNYIGYTDTWNVNERSIGSHFTCSTKIGYPGHCHEDNVISTIFKDHTLITTEQFRAKYGKELRQKDILDRIEQATHLVTSTIKVVNAINTQSTENVEILRLTKENESLKMKLLMLTSKIETAKTVLD